jgi:gamma-glutamyl phosphate reductase
MNKPIKTRLLCRSNVKAGGLIGVNELTSYKLLGVGNRQIRIEFKA